jgi:hypothetical protein
MRAQVPVGVSYYLQVGGLERRLQSKSRRISLCFLIAFIQPTLSNLSKSSSLPSDNAMEPIMNLHARESRRLKSQASKRYIFKRDNRKLTINII